MFNPRRRFQAASSSSGSISSSIYRYQHKGTDPATAAPVPRQFASSDGRQSLNLVDRLAQRETYGSPFSAASCVAGSAWGRSLVDSRLEHATRFYYKDLVGHFGCVNTVEFSADGSLLASGGDCRRLLLWNVWDAVNTPNYSATEMQTQHNSNIFCIAFDAAQQRVYSGGNDEMVIIHNIETGESIEQIGHMDDVYGLSVDPTNNNVFASASNEVTLWDIRSPSVKSTRLATSNSGGPFHAVMHSPADSHLLVSANAKEGVAVYDSRRPLHRLMHFYSSSVMSSQGAMCVRFNRQGRLILALRRKQPPVLYDLRSPYPLVEFDAADYYNSCTIKNCCFAGADEGFIAAGSDNFKVYIWAVPQAVSHSSEGSLRRQEVHYVPQARQILNGHRSIVNHVRFNEHNGMLASTGVEKLVKLWSPLVRFDCEGGGSTSTDDKVRKTAGRVKSQDFSLETHISRNVYTHRDYINLVHGDRGGAHINHDYSSNNTSEDRKMIAYFDSMIEREVNSATLLDSSDNESGSYYSLILPKEIDFNEHLDNCKSLQREMDREEEESSNEEESGEETEEDEDGRRVVRKVERVAFRDSDLSMNSDAAFEVQKRFNFYLGTPKPRSARRGGTESDHLAYVFAKRMHARYLLSYLDGLLERVEGLESIAEKKRKKAEERAAKEAALAAGLPPPKKPAKRVSLRNSSLFLWIRPQLLLANINEQIKRKKEGELIFFSYKFAKTLLTAYHFGTLFNVREQKRVQISAKHDESLPRLMDLNCRATVRQQIRAMARITTTSSSKSSKEGQEEQVQCHLHDRRLYELLSRLYRRIIYLLNLLSDSAYDIKAKRREFLRELHPHPIIRYRSSLGIAPILDQSEDSEDMERAALDHHGGILLEAVAREMEEHPDDDDIEIEHMYPFRRNGEGSISEDTPSSTSTIFENNFSSEEEANPDNWDEVDEDRRSSATSSSSSSAAAADATAQSSSSSSSSEAASSSEAEPEAGTESENESENESETESRAAESNSNSAASSPAPPSPSDNSSENSSSPAASLPAPTDGGSSDSSPDSSSSSFSSSSSSSSDDHEEEEEDSDEVVDRKRARTKRQKIKPRSPAKKCNTKRANGRTAASASTASAAGPSTSKVGSTEGVYFKKSNRDNKSYKDSARDKRRKRRRSPSPSPSEESVEPEQVEEEEEEEEDQEEEARTNEPPPRRKRRKPRRKVCKRKRQCRS